MSTIADLLLSASLVTMALEDGADAESVTWYVNRGRRDAERGKGSLFRKVGSTLQCNIDSDRLEEWAQWKRQAYMLGYDSTTECHCSQCDKGA